MSSTFLLVSAIALLGLQDPAPNPGPPAEPARLEDVVVDGRRLEELVSDFVAEAAVPARGRGLARWDDDVCVGVVNLRARTAQYFADRISQVAMELGLRPGDPGCRANIVIVFTDDANALTARLAEEHRRAFRVGTGGIDRGEVAFEDFVGTDRPVRWWHVSMPVDAETGRRAIRLPGDVDNQGNPTAPHISTFASRLNSQIRDDLRRVMVIVDIDDVAGVDGRKLADYLAFVSLAQVDPAGDYSSYDSILRLFARPQLAPGGLTEWDLSYLDTLYRTLDNPLRRRNPNAVAAGVAGAMTRDLRRTQEQDAPAEAEPETPAPNP